jgi:uncharacterized protein
VSQLSHKFTTDAREVVKTGDVVKVRVVEVDLARKRIALSMKLGEAPAGPGGARGNRFEPAPRSTRAQPAGPVPTAMAGAFARLSAVRK